MEKLDIDAFVESIDIVKSISKFVKLKRTGSNFNGLCPFHSENTPSFVVSPAKKIYKCFGCGASGNIINFYMNYKNLEFIEAVNELSLENNLNINIGNVNLEKREQKIKEFKILNQVTEFYHLNLINKVDDGVGLAYLNNREITIETIKKHKLGYASRASNSLFEYLINLGYEQEDLFSLGLISNIKDNHLDTFRERIIFPIFSSNDQVVGFGGRALSNKALAKYINSKESIVFKKGKLIYGAINKFKYIKEQEFVILVEGYMDVLRLCQNGITNTVATLGTALTNDQAQILKKQTNNVILAYDLDKAGETATERAIYILKKLGFNIRKLNFENAKDPDEYLQKFGKVEFVNKLGKAQEVFEYIYDRYLKEIDILSIMGKKLLIEKLMPFFLSLTDSVEYDLYITELSKKLSIEKAALNNKFRPSLALPIQQNFIRPRYRNFKKKDFVDSIKSIPKDPKNILEFETIKLILKNKKYIEQFKNKCFKNKFYIKIIENINEKNLKEFNDFTIFTESEYKELINLSLEIINIENELEYLKDILKQWKYFENKEEEKKIIEKLKDQNLAENIRQELLRKRYEILKRIKE